MYALGIRVRVWLFRLTFNPVTIQREKTANARIRVLQTNANNLFQIHDFFKMLLEFLIGLLVNFRAKFKRFGYY